MCTELSILVLRCEHAGYIERLEDAGVKAESFDIAISNCVVNLSPDKPAVLKEVYRCRHGIALSDPVPFTPPSLPSAPAHPPQPDRLSRHGRRDRALAPGGEFYFSDVYCDRRLPKSVQQNEVAHRPLSPPRPACVQAWGVGCCGGAHGGSIGRRQWAMVT